MSAKGQSDAETDAERQCTSQAADNTILSAPQWIAALAADGRTGPEIPRHYATGAPPPEEIYTGNVFIGRSVDRCAVGRIGPIRLQCLPRFLTEGMRL